MKRLLCNLGVAAVILLMVEVVFLLAEEDSKYRHSELTGYELMPGYWSEREQVNSSGLRGPEIGPKTPGTFRILAMGGSTTYGSDLPEDGTWPQALQRSLRADGFDSVEVLNGGVAGWGIEQVVVALEERYIEEFEPDLVLVYSGWNRATMENSPTIARYLYKSKTSPGRKGVHRFAIGRWLSRKLEDVSMLEDWAEIDRVSRWKIVDDILAENYPRLSARLAAVCRERGVELAFIRYPSLIQVLPEGGGEFRDVYLDLLHHDKYQSLDYDELVHHATHQYGFAGDVIQASTEAADIRLLDVATRFLAAYQPHLDDERFAAWIAGFTDRMHLTPSGNEVLGRVLADLLVEQGLVTTS